MSRYRQGCKLKIRCREDSLDFTRYAILADCLAFQSDGVHCIAYCARSVSNTSKRRPSNPLHISKQLELIVLHHLRVSSVDVPGWHVYVRNPWKNPFAVVSYHFVLLAPLSRHAVPCHAEDLESIAGEPVARTEERKSNFRSHRHGFRMDYYRRTTAF